MDPVEEAELCRLEGRGEPCEKKLRMRHVHGCAELGSKSCA